MATLELKAYEIFKSKLGAEEAETVIEYIETKIEKNVERNVKQLATKEDVSKLREEITTTKSELRAEIASTKAELKVKIATTKSELLGAVYVVGLVQFLAIVCSVLGLMSIDLK